jgi:sugar/nucleoside kinase (ribokinase family)
MKSHYDIVGLGDVNIDYVVENKLPFKFRELRENGAIWWENIDEVPGGSALNFCALANGVGYHSLLLSKVGNDMAGLLITNWLNERKLSMALNWAAQAPTGKAIIVRDNADVRLLINNKQNANDLLYPSDIEEHKNDITSSTVLYISGYCISNREAPRFRAASLAMDYARSTSSASCPTVVFDVVPHRIYEKYTFEEFLRYTQKVDILISEVATIRRFLGRGSKSETIDRKTSEETMKDISQYYDRVVLRYGASGCDEQLLWDKSTDTLVHALTDHASVVDKRGFGDLLTIKCLQNFFKVLPDKTK